MVKFDKAASQLNTGYAKATITGTAKGTSFEGIEMVGVAD